LGNAVFRHRGRDQPDIDLLTKVVPADNILFASEMVGAVKGIDPTPNLSDADKKKVFEDNALRVYPRLQGQAQGNA
jgi:4-oxalmesaconate hydratase